MLSSPARPAGKRWLIHAALLVVALGAVLVARATIATRLEVEAYLERGARWIEQGDTGRAEAEWMTAVRLAPRNPRLTGLSARCGCARDA